MLNYFCDFCKGFHVILVEISQREYTSGGRGVARLLKEALESAPTFYYVRANFLLYIMWSQRSIAFILRAAYLLIYSINASSTIALYYIRLS